MALVDASEALMCCEMNSEDLSRRPQLVGEFGKKTNATKDDGFRYLGAFSDSGLPFGNVVEDWCKTFSHVNDGV